MSIQLILYPQSYDGTNPITGTPDEFIVDGVYFTTINASSTSLSLAFPVYQSAINLLNPTMAINTWYRFSGNTNSATQSAGEITFSSTQGVLQKVSNLITGANYSVNVTTSTNPSNLFLAIYTGTTIHTYLPISNLGLNSLQFIANSSTDTIVIYSGGTNIVSSISVLGATQLPSGAIQDLSNGQVICDLYEDEDIPLTLSVDNFKNVAEKVQSYSKAFNLPATKRNNQIFDNIFEITRTDNGLVFNPYVKTQCELKQDGFILFEGYLKLIDIQDKAGEISYNVNLYSEVVALADVLKDKTFNDINFLELQHNYSVDNITNSWNSQTTGITYTNASTSGYRDSYNTVKYPLVDWTHSFWVGGSNDINFTSIADIFRPFINIKYLIDRIFQDTPFTYESSFFNEVNFLNLFMDFNWGSDNIPSNSNLNGFYGASLGINPNTPYYAGTTFTNLTIYSTQTSIFTPVPPDYNTATNTLTNTTANNQYSITYSYEVKNTDTVSRDVEFRILSSGQVFDYSGVITLAANQSYTYAGTLTVPPLAIGDTLELQFKASVAGVISQINYNVGWLSSIYTFESMLNSLRGELGQWEFLKGIMTMFNLVSIPDKSNPNNIFIEPYSDAFLSSNDTANPNFFDNNSTKLDWTDKIDVSEMKLTPLTDLNKNTIFKFVEDDDDYAFSVYKKALSGFLYGSKEFDASNFTILQGEEEIVAEPFAATLVKPLEDTFADFITPSIYSHNADSGTSEGFDNSPRIMFNNGIKNISTYSYDAPLPNGSTGFLNENQFLQFSHLTQIPSTSSAIDFNFGECQYIQPVGSTTSNNLFNYYWLPYFNELYNPDTRTMTLKVNLNAGDINRFEFYDTVFIKNREFRVNKIDYKPNDLATVEFILII